MSAATTWRRWPRRSSGTGSSRTSPRRARGSRPTTSRPKILESVPRDREAGLAPQPRTVDPEDQEAPRSQGDRPRRIARHERPLHRRGLHGRRAQVALPRVRDRVRPAPRVCARATTPATSTGRSSRKTERYYIKQYEQETNFVAHLLVDGEREHEVRLRRDHEARLRQDDGGLPVLPGPAPAGRHRARASSTTRSGNTCRAATTATTSSRS